MASAFACATASGQHAVDGLLGIDVRVGAGLARFRDDHLQRGHLGFSRGIGAGGIELRVRRQRDRLQHAGLEPVPQLFGDERHQWVQQAQRLFVDHIGVAPIRVELL
jgi:hypothetical protein